MLPIFTGNTKFVVVVAEMAFLSRNYDEDDILSGYLTVLMSDPIVYCSYEDLTLYFCYHWKLQRIKKLPGMTGDVLLGALAEVSTMEI